MLRLPAPWGPLGAFQGCTRAHAVALVPVRWRLVAEGFALAAAAVAAEGRASPWHRQQIALYRSHADRAAWLDGRPAAWRALALTLWAAGDDLDLEETEAIVAAVLAEPPAGPSSMLAAPFDAASGG